jgi:hypothetical protein
MSAGTSFGSVVVVADRDASPGCGEAAFAAAKPPGGLRGLPTKLGPVLMGIVQLVEGQGATHAKATRTGAGRGPTGTALPASSGPTGPPPSRRAGAAGTLRPSAGRLAAIAGRPAGHRTRPELAGG